MVRPISTYRPSGIVEGDTNEVRRAKIFAAMLREEIEEYIACEQLGLYLAKHALAKEIVETIALCGGMEGAW